MHKKESLIQKSQFDRGLVPTIEEKDEEKDQIGNTSACNCRSSARNAHSNPLESSPKRIVLFPDKSTNAEGHS